MIRTVTISIYRLSHIPAQVSKSKTKTKRQNQQEQNSNFNFQTISVRMQIYKFVPSNIKTENNLKVEQDRQAIFNFKHLQSQGHGHVKNGPPL